MTNDSNTLRIKYRGITYLIKESFEPFSCIGCANHVSKLAIINEEDDEKLEKLSTFNACRNLKPRLKRLKITLDDKKLSHCGLGSHIIVEDNIPSLMEYLENKVNHVHIEDTRAKYLNAIKLSQKQIVRGEENGQ